MAHLIENKILRTSTLITSVGIIIATLYTAFNFYFHVQSSQAQTIKNTNEIQVVKKSVDSLKSNPMIFNQRYVEMSNQQEQIKNEMLLMKQTMELWLKSQQETNKLFERVISERFGESTEN